ncbi:MAG TPA: nuclear transport factor 2 family protein [Caulobacteraceae bacterium]|jgi:hypothetical protein
MPSRETLDAFIAQVVAGDHVGAIRDWYLDDATMQENQAEPRRGRETLMAGEARTLSRMESVTTEVLDEPLLAGDRVAIRWRFTFHLKDGGGTMVMEEIAWQRWRGDKIAEDVFFYDPAQRALRPAA